MLQPQIGDYKRVEHLRQTCETYRRDNPKVLEQENIADPSANYVQNWATKFFICVPSENGAIPWNRFFRQIHNYDLKVSSGRKINRRES